MNNKNLNDINGFYHTFGFFDFLSVIDAKNTDDSNAQKYYSIPSLTDSNKRYSVAFIQEFPQKMDADVLKERRVFSSEGIPFLFNDEFSSLFNSGHNIYGKYVTTFNDNKKSRELIEHINQNPVVIVFKGLDDSSCGLRFKTREDAITYFMCLIDFEDVFNDKDLKFLN